MLRRLREALGNELPIVVTHDAHANVAPVEIELATALVIYKEVPHVDQRERGLHAARIMDAIVNKGAKPTMAIEKPPMLYNILYHNTKREPMLPLVTEARRLERDNPKILGVSVPVGYQYADTPQMGPSVVVVTDNDPELARREAKRLADMMYEHRHVMQLDLPDSAEAVRRAMAEEKGPVVLVEMGDNIGGGSAGDSTFILSELVQQKAQGWVVAMWDPEAVEVAVKAGIGGSFDMPVGGKLDKLHGEPVQIRGTVKLIYDGEYVEPAVRHGGRRYLDQGLTAVIHAQGSTPDEPNVVILNSKRHTPLQPGPAHQRRRRPDPPEDTRGEGSRRVPRRLRAHRRQDHRDRHGRLDGGQPETLYLSPREVRLGRTGVGAHAIENLAQNRFDRLSRGRTLDRLDAAAARAAAPARASQRSAALCWSAQAATSAFWSPMTGSSS